MIIDENDVENTDTIDVSASDPALATLSEMDRCLTPSRRKLVNEILFQLNSKQSKSARHHTLIVGPAGSGKSRIMHYLQTILGHFQKDTVIMKIQEDARSILSFFDFIVTCLRHYDAVSTDELMETVLSTNAESLNAVIALFDEHTANRKTAIFVDDFGDLFHNMSGEDRDAMQAFFSERNHITVVASSLSLIVEKRMTLGSLSNLFSVRRLLELTADETSMFLGRLLINQKYLPPMESETMMVFHHIVGGHQQLMEDTGRLLDAREWPEIGQVAPELIQDIFIPYFSRRICRLDRNQRFVLKAIALHSGEAISEERLGSLVEMDSELLAETLEVLKLALYIEQTRVGQVMYFDIHEPFLRILLERGDEAEEEFRTLITLTAHWLEAERRSELEYVPKPVADEATVASAVELADAAKTDQALESFEAILETDPQNPIAATQAFAIHLTRKREDALSFLEGVFAARGHSLNNALDIVRLIGETTNPDLELRAQLVGCYTGPTSLLPQSLIHAFLEQRGEDEASTHETIMPILAELAEESDVMEVLHELVKRYLHRESDHEQALLHIPVELRTLLTKHAKGHNQLYAR